MNAQQENPISFLLTDGHSDVNDPTPVKISVHAEVNGFGLALRVEGCGMKTMETGFNQVVIIEKYGGDIRVLVWADINQEDPTHIISMEGARESKRKQDDTEDDPRWSPEDQLAAQTQGWDIFETGRCEASETAIVNGKPYGHRPFEIQSCDEADIFTGDNEAHVFIRRQFALEDPLVLRAAKFLAYRSPFEYEAIFINSDTKEKS